MTWTKKPRMYEWRLHSCIRGKLFRSSVNGKKSGFDFTPCCDFM